MRDSASTIKRITRDLKQQKWFIVAVTIFSIVLVITLAVYFLSPRTSTSQKLQGLFEGRNFQYSPFELMDAHDVCLYNARDELGSGFLRSHVDDLSTRFDTRDNVYLIVLNVDVGTVNGYNTAKIYCTVDPSSYQLTYYKEVHEGKQSLLSRTLSFFSRK